MNDFKPRRVLAVIPIAALIASFLVVNAVGPYDLVGRVDPEYVELFNSLSLPTFHAPANMAHPGTTLQELGSAIILTKWAWGNFWGNWAPLETSVLTHAQDYLHAINFVLNLLLSLTMYLAARAIYRVSRSLPAALALQCSFVLFWQLTVMQSRVMPEPLLISVMYVLMIALARVVWHAEEVSGERSGRLPAIAGAIFGFGVVTKLSILPVASVVLLFGGWRRIRGFVAGAIGGTILFLIPVTTRIPEAAGYYWRFFSHTGYYGQGSEGLPAASVLRGNLIAILNEEPFLGWMFLIYSAILLFGWWKRPTEAALNGGAPDGRMLRMVVFSGWTTTVIAAALVAQHFRTHYLLPAMMYDGFVNAAIVAHYGGRLRRSVKIPLAACCIALVLCGAVRTGGRAVVWAEGQRAERADDAKLMEKVRAMPECLQMGFNYSAAPMRALHFGDQLSDFQQGPMLAALYPGSLSYSWQDGKALSFTGEDETRHVTDLVAGGRCVLLVGSLISTLEGAFALPPGMTYKTVAVEGSQGIYRLVQRPAPAAHGSSKDPAFRNLALGKPATQSSTMSDAGKAVDGNTDGAYFHGSLSHTGADENAWWQVDLGAPAKIASIVIWNRTDCCSGRLSDFWIFVSDVPFGPKDTPANLQNRPGTWHNFQTDIPSPSVEVIVGGARGRYVRIQLNGKNLLSLAEVQVYAATPTAP
ncbi:MAG: discoidin domain-containing protein [Bryobacteraceae bacterium]